MLIILFISGMAAAFIAIAAILEKKDIIENGVLAFTGYWCVYVIVSGLLFWIDRFQMTTAAAAVLLIELTAIGIRWRKIRFSEWYCNIREYAFPLVLSLLLLPVVWDKFELYGMGQDEGVYQTQAIAFLCGDTENQQEIDTYQKVSENEQLEYQDIISRKLVGFYLYDDTLPTLDADKKLGEASGYYHGVPTFSAVLALWGSIAGMENMTGIQTWLYVCAMLLIFLTGRSLGMKSEYQKGAVLVFALSPIAIWVCKAALTEMLLTCIILLFLYFLVQKEERAGIWLSILPVLAFSFYHITIYTVIPVIMLVYYSLYLMEGKKEYLIAAAAELAGFAAGIHMMAKVAATYSFVYNFRPIYDLVRFIHQGNILPVLTICSGMGMVVSAALYICTRKRVPYRLIRGTKGYHIVILSIRLVTALLLIWNLIVIISECRQTGWKTAIGHSTLVGYALFTGIVLLIYALFGIMIRTDTLLKDKGYMCISLLFIYCILVYAAIFRKNISHYYYYGRYLVPYIPIIILSAYVLVGQFKRKWLRTVCWFSSLVVVLVIAVVYDTLLAEEKDDTRLSWEVLQDCSELFHEGDNVIVDREAAAVMFLPLMHLTESDVYIEYQDDELKNAQIGTLAEEADGSLYFVTDEYYGSPHWESVYVGYYEKSEDDNSTTHLIPFPLEMQKKSCRVYVYRYYPSRTEYPLNDTGILISNFYGVEGDARWTDGRGSLYCYLEPEGYEICIQQGAMVPLEELGRDSMTITLYMNDRKIGEYVLNEQNRQEDIIFHIRKEDVLENRNELVIQCDAWSPSDMGRSDTRQLGLSIRAVNFIPN